MNVVLQEAGYVVDSAACAEDGLRLLEEHDYRLLLSDYSLPGYSGLWLLLQAFERKLVAPGAALIITGDPDVPGIKDIAPVVPKPVDFEQLLSRVRTVLENSASAGADVAA